MRDRRAATGAGRFAVYRVVVRTNHGGRMHKSERLILRVSAEEKAAWARAASAQGVSLAEWIRARLGDKVTVAPPSQGILRAVDPEDVEKDEPDDGGSAGVPAPRRPFVVPRGRKGPRKPPERLVPQKEPYEHPFLAALGPAQATRVNVRGLMPVAERKTWCDECRRKGAQPGCKVCTYVT